MILNQYINKTVAPSLIAPPHLFLGCYKPLPALGEKKQQNILLLNISSVIPARLKDISRSGGRLHCVAFLLTEKLFTNKYQ